MKKFKVIREKDEVIVVIAKYKDTDKYSFVNLTKGHICKCVFNSIDEAISDLENYKAKGKIIDYEEVENII